MNYPRFLLFNVAGGLLWGAGVTAAGYYLGRTIPELDRYFLVIVMAVVLVSASPVMLHMVKVYGPEVRPYLCRRYGAIGSTPRSEVHGSPREAGRPQVEPES
jgi:hypothetical protein